MPFATTAFVERIRWSMDETVTSDHYGIVVKILNTGPAPMPQHNPQWKVDKA